jgi:CMP/dCMP kinase
MSHQIITISGTPGSGKSTIAIQLAQKLEAERIYVGGIRRDLAKKKGMTLAELNIYALTHPETDVDIDKLVAKNTKELAKTSPVIAEGRTMFHFIPDSIKIYIKSNFDTGAERIWKALQFKENKDARNEANVSSLEELKIKLHEREGSDIMRYKKYYDINHTDLSNYDIIIDTTKLNRQEAAKKTLEAIKALKR